MTSYVTIGTCSLCGGPVSVPSPWWSVVPPTPTCQERGAAPLQHGNIIAMKQPQKKMFTTTKIEIS